MRILLFSGIAWLFFFNTLDAQVGYQWNMEPEQPTMFQQPAELNLPLATTFPGVDIFINLRAFDIIRGPIKTSPTSIMLPGTAPQPFFCRMEWMAEQQLNFPIRVRLGDVDYVDWLEGKGFRN